MSDKIDLTFTSFFLIFVSCSFRVASVFGIPSEKRKNWLQDRYN